MVVKAGLIYLLCRLFGSNHADATRVALVLAAGR